MMFFGIKFIETNASSIAEDMDDDEGKAQFENMAENGSFKLIEGMVDLFLVVSIAMHGCGIYGALKFQPWAIIVAAVAYGITLFFALLGVNLIQIIVCGVFLYPHIILLKEIQAGIMSEVNYEHVANCCGTV